MIRRTLVVLSLAVSGCAVNQSTVSEQDYLHNLALNEAATSQVRDTGFYVPRDSALVNDYDQAQLQQSIHDWQSKQVQGELYAVLQRANGSWSLKEIVTTQPAYAANDARYKVLSLRSNIKGGVTRLVMK